jgi:hypothetical protein
VGRVRLAATLTLVACVGAAAAAARGHAEGPPPLPVREGECTRPVDYGTAKFRWNSHRVTHPLLPLKPGTQRVFEGRSNVTGAVLPHRVSFTVTSLTKKVDGVRGRVVWDVDESDGEVAEAELAIFAQDANDNVWNLGEYPEEYPDGVFIGAPNTWFAGVGDAEPGIHMLERPEVGLPEYLQGWVPEIEFLDCATVVESGASVCVPAGCFSDVLVIHERSPLDPAGGIQVKYHAPGVGIVQIGAIDDPEAETLVLTEFNRLSRKELRQANREAHILNQRGLQCDEVYAQTATLRGPGNRYYGPYTCGTPEEEPPEPPPTAGGDTTQAPWSSAPAPLSQPPSPPAESAVRYRGWVNHPLFPLRTVRTRLYAGRQGGHPVRIESRVRGRRVRVGALMATAVDLKRYRDGKLRRRATEYYVQDLAGNVWFLGDRVSEIRNGRVTGHTGQWIAGRGGAQHGLLIPAMPKLGESFLKTDAPGIARDRSTVVGLNVRVRVAAAAKRVTGCVRFREDDLLRGSAPKHKIYCPGVGLVSERSADRLVRLVKYGRR